MSFEPYQSYKYSGLDAIGLVPEHWESKKLSQLVSFAGGGTPNRDRANFWNGDLPWVSPKDMKSEVISGAEECITDAGLNSSATSLVPPGALLIVVRSGILKHTIPAAINTVPIALNQDMKALRFGQTCTSRFFLRWIQGHQEWLLLQWGKQGATVESIEQEYLARTVIPLPPLDEQEAIANFLDRETAKIDAMVEEQRRLITLLKEKRQAVISYAVTKGLDPTAPLKSSGIPWLGDVPAHWEVKPLRYLCEAFDQGWSPQCEGHPVDSPAQWGVLKVGCVNEGLFDPSENKLLPDDLDPRPELSVRRGDLLISRANTRDLVGSAAFVATDHDKLMISDKLYRLRFAVGVEMSQYIAFVLGTRGARGEIELDATGASSSMLNIAQDTILSLPVPVPPFAEVEAICSALEKTLTKLAQRSTASDGAITLLQERRAALISAAVSGKIDVRGWAADDVRDAVSAEIIHFHARDRTFGRVENQKLHFLANAYAGIYEIGGRFQRQAAGPHDAALMSAVERSLTEKGVIQVSQKGGVGSQVTYTVSKNTRPDRERLKAMLGDRLGRLDHLLTTLGGLGKHGVEAIATLFGVWNDAILDGETPDNDRLVRGFLNEWHAEKPLKFREAEVRNWIGFMRRNGLVPEGLGPHTTSGTLL